MVTGVMLEYCSDIVLFNMSAFLIYENAPPKVVEQSLFLVFFDWYIGFSCNSFVGIDFIKILL